MAHRLEAPVPIAAPGRIPLSAARQHRATSAPSAYPGVPAASLPAPPRPAEERAGDRGPGGRGFALPAALLALVLLGLLSSTGWLVSLVEYRVSESHSASVEAFYAADGALEGRIGLPDRPAPGAGVPRLAEPGTAVVGVPPGRTLLAWEPLLRLGDGGLLVRAEATAHAPAGPAGRSRRTLGALLVLPAGVRPVAALSALTGVEDAAGAVLSGVDAAPPGDCDGSPRPALAGVALADAPPDGSPAPAGAEGSPAVLVPAPAAAFAAAVRLALEESALQVAGEDTGAPRPGPWPRPDTLPPDAWPLLRVEGAPAVLDAGHGGRGTVLAAGDLTLESGFRWDGLLLVAGGLRVEADVRLRGAVVAGLSSLWGAAPGPVVLAGPAIDIRYHSCHAAAAAGALPGLPVRVPGTWRERI